MRAGRAVAADAGVVGKRVVLELGGSDPFIVLEDADLTKAVQMCRIAPGQRLRGQARRDRARYTAAGRDYVPSGAPFANNDELRAVLGMPQLGLRLIRRDQLHGGICHRLVMEWVLCPSKDA